MVAQPDTRKPDASRKERRPPMLKPVTAMREPSTFGWAERKSSTPRMSSTNFPSSTFCMSAMASGRRS